VYPRVHFLIYASSGQFTKDDPAARGRLVGLAARVPRAATIWREIPALGRIPTPQSAGRLESQTGARPRYRRPRKGWLRTEKRREAPLLSVGI
jgi:hypothetical protein